MLYLTQVYMKTSAYRKNTMLLEYAAENGIKQGYDRLREYFALAPSPLLITETEAFQFLQDARAQGNAAVQRALGIGLPLVSDDRWEKMSWESFADFQFSRLHERPHYFFVEYRGEIFSSGQLQGFEPDKSAVLDSDLGILAGHIPLSSIPFLVDKSMTPEEKLAFLEKNEIHMIPSEQTDLPSSVSFTDGGLLPQQAVKPLSEALKIEIFHPQDLSAAQLRLSLGLEVNNDPVPDGVYLIQDDLGLGGIFVQGDLDEMILAIDDEYQIILFRQGEDVWVLRFSPTNEYTSFARPAGVQSFDQVPVGVIIVNGKILSLGGGYEKVPGQVVMAVEKEIPCVLHGVNLAIISSDEITLSSHLIYEGVRWMDGVPYVKDGNAQLLIHAVGQDFSTGEKKRGEIKIDENSPDRLKVHASMTASNGGVTVYGKDKQIQVLGSIQTTGLALNGNEISIMHDDLFFRSSPSLPENAPLTELPVLYISRFQITCWRDS
jgi:hypothetical protein